jgi:hypothetical protein
VRHWHGLWVAPTTAPGEWAVLAAVLSGLGRLVVFPVVAFGTTGGWMPWGILLIAAGIPAFVGAVAAPILSAINFAVLQPLWSIG